MKLHVATASNLREAIDTLREPFIWSRQPVDTKAVERAYAKAGKPFLLNRHGTAGVFPAESHWLIPKGAGYAWMQKHLGVLIATSELFNSTGNVFVHTGDIGDIIAALPVIRHLDGGDLIISYQPNGQRESMKGARYELLRPLLEAQPYITSVSYEDFPVGVTHDFRGFRKMPWQPSETLTHWQGRSFGLNGIDMSPWLHVKGMPHDRVIVARSLRYWGNMPWTRIVQRFGNKLLFIGLQDEHSAMCRIMGRHIEKANITNFYDMAQLIGGASLFIGNQSAPFWVAAAMNIPVIQETSTQNANSLVKFPHAHYTQTRQEMLELGQFLQTGRWR